MALMMLGKTEKHTVQSFVRGPSCFEVENAIEKMKIYTSWILNKLQ
jgi:hypothetical protein